MEKTNRKIEEYSWYMVCTVAKKEQKVSEWFVHSGVESYLPVQSVVRLWNNHKKQLVVPIMSGCIFVHLSAEGVTRLTNNSEFTLLMKEDGSYVSVTNAEMYAFQETMNKTGECVIRGKKRLLSQLGLD